MKLSQFDFELPQEKIATELMPEVNGHIQWRDECKLMVLHKDSGEIEHRVFKDIIDYFGKGDRFVLNDTKVFPAKLYGKKEKTGADIMVFLLRELNREQRLWDVIVDPARKIRIGNKLYFGEDESMVAEVIDNTTSRGRTLRFLYDGPYDEFKAALFALGQTPVPEWVKQTPTERDAEEFQTVFATHEGAVSAPAAGLHFSRELLNRMILKDIEKTFITVHMGIGHFRTVDVEDLSKHRMDGERFIISEQAAAEINRTKRSGRRICAVGDQQVHLPSVRLLRARRAGVQLPPAGIHDADVRGCFRRLREGDERLSVRPAERLPLRPLRRRPVDYLTRIPYLCPGLLNYEKWTRTSSPW